MASRLDSQRERFEADPSDARAFQALEEHYFLEGSWEELARVYELRVAAIDPSDLPRERAGVLFRFGQALEEGFGNLDRASDCYREALGLDPELEPARRRLRQLSVSRGDTEGAIGLLEQEAERTSGERRVRLLLEVGELCLGTGADPARAVEAYEATLREAPGTSAALVGRARALSALALRDDAQRAWSEAIDGLDGAERAEAYEALIASLEPASEEAVETYWRAHADEPQTARWIEGLAEALAGVERWEEAAALGEERIARTRGAERRAEIAIELGRLSNEHLNDPVGARRWFAKAAEWHESADLHIALAEVAVVDADESLRASHLARAMELDSNHAAVAAVAAAPEQRPSALEALRERAAAAPEDPGAQRALSEGLESAGLYAELVEVLERRVALCREGSEERGALLYRIGELRERELGQNEAAADAFQLCFAVSPSFPGVVATLERLLRGTGQLPELDALLDQAAGAADERERPALLCSLGALRYGELDDVAGAIDAFRRALACDPAHRDATAGLRRAAEECEDAALRRSAIAAEIDVASAARIASLMPTYLELAHEAGDERGALDAMRRWCDAAPDSREALEALADGLSSAGLTEELAETLERLDGVVAPEERGGVRRRLGYLHAAEGRTDLAVDAWRRALEADPDDAASAEALVDGLWESGRPGELVEVLEGDWRERTRAVRGADAKYAAALEATGRVDDALAVHRALCREEPRDAETVVRFEQAARAAHHPEALADALALRVQQETGAAAQTLALERAVLLDTDLHREEEAAAAYRSLVGDAEDGAVRDEADRRLGELLERRGEIDALCAHLEARCPELPARDACEAHARIALLAETHLSDLGRARRHLQSAVALRPERGDLWRQLAELYDEESQPAELLRAVEGELATQPDDTRRLALTLRAGRLCGERDPERAESFFARALEIDPVAADACAFLVARYDETGRSEDAQALLRAQLASLDGDPDDSAAARRNALRLALADRLGETPDAIALLEAALDDARDGGEIAHALVSIAERLAGLYESAARDDDYRALCDRVAQHCERPAEAARWWERLARAAADQGDSAAATDAFERALDHAAQPERVRAALIEIHRGEDHAERLAELLEIELAAAPDAPALLEELADLYETRLARPERALAHLETLTAIDSREVRWWERALALATEADEPERALGLLRGAVEFGPSAHRADWLEQLAHLLRDELARPAEAIEAFRHLLRAAPGHPDARRVLRELLFAEGHHDEGFAVLHSEVERAAPEAQLALVETALELGRAGPAGPGLEADAYRPWIARFEALAGERGDLLVRAAHAYREMGDIVACERALARATHSEEDDRALRELHLERAALLVQDGMAPRRIDALEAARTLGPEDPDLLRQLDELYTAERRYRELLTVLEARIAIAGSPAAAAPLRRRMAVLCTESVAEPLRAAALWAELLDPEAPDLEAARRGAVGDVLHAAGYYRLWAPIAEAELEEEIEGSPRWLHLRGRLAAAYERHLGRPREALRHYRALADAGHADEPQHRSLLRLLLRDGAAGEWSRRVEHHLQNHPGDAQAWIALARVREELLAHTERAAEAFARAAELDPSQSAAWSGLRRTSELLGAWGDVADAMEHLIEQGAVPAGPSWRSLGEIALRRLEDLDRARSALVRAREIAPQDLEALRLLREVATAQDELAECADLYRAEIELIDVDDSARRELWLAIAGLAGGPLCDWERCAEAYAQADRIAPLPSPDLASWCEALLASGVSDATTRSWAEVFERWCDGAEGEAGAHDHERLAKAWSQLGERERATRRIERSLEIDPGRADAWVLAAELRDDPTGVCEAWRRAAECSNGPSAARSYERAAAAAEESEDAETAWSMYQAASEVDPSAELALAGMARIGASTGRSAPAAEAATRLLALAPDPGAYPEALRAGAACALERAEAAGRDRGPWEQARDLCDALLQRDEHDVEARWLRGRARFELGDLRGARVDFEARLGGEPELPERERVLLLEQLGLALVNAGERSAAIGRLRECLEIDPTRGEAHRGLAETLELMGRRGEAAAAWARWAEHGGEPEARRRAERFERAAAFCEPGDERAEEWLRAANRADPSYAPTLLALVERLVAAERFDEALRAAEDGVIHLPVGKHLAKVESLRGRVLEQQRDLDGALEAYRRAVELDTEGIEDVRAAGRLLRGRGDWEGAAALLRSFASAATQDNHCGEVLLDLGRLLAGPLEDIPGAVEAYRRARQLAPDREDVRESLADLLAQFPDHRDEAVAEHRALLRNQPLRQRSLRALLTIAERESKRPRTRHGKALLTALGCLSSFEREPEAGRLDMQIGRDTQLGGDLAHALQKAAQVAAPHCEALLPELELPEARKRPVTEAVSAFRDAFFAAEAERLGAGWLALPPEALREVLGELVRASQNGDDAGPLRDAPGRARRKLRKALSAVSPADLETFDVASWRREIELHALAIAVDVTGGALRPALLFALAEASDHASLEFGDDVDLSPWLESDAPATRLFERALHAWLDSF